MADIAMCSKIGCPVARSCKRHESSGTKPALFQAHSTFNGVGEQCDGFWPTYNYKTATGAGDGNLDL